MRTAVLNRTTTETDVSVTLNLDGNGESAVDTGCGFLDHMLTLFARHGRFDLTLNCVGDVHVDYHHTTEDIGIVLGQAFACALGDKRGVHRYGSMLLPMDEALILCALDLSGRAHLQYALDIPTQKVGDFDTELTKEFFLGFVRSAACTLHLRQLSGENSHHIIEGAFKAFGRAMKEAVAIDVAHGNEIPSTKGIL
ncbi:MAG: imidazoleglycerol-phosphate dehydratase HisB [Ruminococcaceae bacterium]|nr:imidazoleglycerol-phosphate dehydratase HisB [Oscillospiraceae bacterium]